MNRVRLLLIFCLAAGLMIPLLTGCMDSDDDSGPEDFFPADYTGTFKFDGLPYEFPLEFTIQISGAVSGRVQGSDGDGYWDFFITGSLVDNTLRMTIDGEYGPPACSIHGEINGTSSGCCYQSFTGTWEYDTCHGVSLHGTWQASRS